MINLIFLKYVLCILVDFVSVLITFLCMGIPVSDNSTLKIYCLFQRLRDGIKTWLASSDIKDKKSLLDSKKVIEMVGICQCF